MSKVPTDGRRAVFTLALAQAERDKAEAERRIEVYRIALKALEDEE